MFVMFSAAAHAAFGSHPLPHRKRKALRAIAQCALLIFFVSAFAFATIFGTVRGVVHDPTHRPVKGAHITIKAQNSEWTRSTVSDQNGEFVFNSVPLGDYTVTVANPGFQQQEEAIVVHANTVPVVHFQLGVQGVKENVEVSGAVQPSDTVTPTALVSRMDIQQTPGADRSYSFSMITDYTPAAYVTHDMLHMSGGHQVSWLIDGVPIPNTNIATNLGPQILPRDIDYVEIYNGSYDADYGDRTYGVFNVLPRTGFESDRECELTLTAGNFYQTDDQIGCGSHTQRFAWYASLNGNRSQYGLQTPIPQVVNDAANGYGGFASFIWNPNGQNQYRLVTSLRRDFYQIPIDPDPNSVTNAYYPTYGLHDAEVEPDGYATLSWVHTFNSHTILTVSPFYHYNGADYNGAPNDYPVSSTVHQDANYLGGQTSLNLNYKGNDLQAGIYGFFQHQYNYFNNIFNDGTPNVPSSSIGVNGGVVSEWLNDKIKLGSNVTIIPGVRLTQFTVASAKNAAVTSSGLTETATDPRLGVAFKIPRLDWVLQGFYGYYYQAPPLVTATGPLLDLANGQDLTFGPLHGERDIQWQFGVTIPFHNWTLAAYNYETRAKDWLDHNNIGESNIFWPITWSRALIQGWSLTLNSPDVFHSGRFHLVYANQIAQASSPINGGLICADPNDPNCPLYIPPGLSPVDHDQRNTLNVGFNGRLPWHAFASTNVYYGSGFTNGLPDVQYPGNYLPQHTTFDLSAGKQFGEKLTVSANAVNVANRRVQLDNSLTFGGFHWNDPRLLYGEVRYRFNY